MDKIVVYASTRNTYPLMDVAAKSLLMNTPIDHVYFLSEDEEYPTPLPDIITAINVSNQPWFQPNGANSNYSWSYMCYIRLALAKIFPDKPLILYLDTDTLVLQDISDMFKTDLSDKLFAMVPEDPEPITMEFVNSFQSDEQHINHVRSDQPCSHFSVRPYCNAGVMLMNLDAMKQSGIDDILIHEINTVKHNYADQDIINVFCHDKIAYLSPAYNTIPAIYPDFPFDQIKIKHFASDKPLWKSSLWQSYRRLSWDDVLRKQEAFKNASK